MYLVSGGLGGGGWGGVGEWLRKGLGRGWGRVGEGLDFYTSKTRFEKPINVPWMNAGSTEITEKKKNGIDRNHGNLACKKRIPGKWFRNNWQ